MKAPAMAEAKPPRQAVIILGESIRADMANSYRHTGLRTPNLDQLTAQGIRFEKAYNCRPACAPARSAIWTGLFPHTNGVWANSMPLMKGSGKPNPSQHSIDCVPAVIRIASQYGRYGYRRITVLLRRGQAIITA